MKNLKLIFSIISIALVFLLVAIFSYNLFEPKAYDFMMKNVVTERLPFDHKKQIDGSSDVVLVMIDSKTVEKYRWPWPRARYCDIIEYFTKYTKAKVIIHDAIITTTDSENTASDKKFFATVKASNNLVEGFLPDNKPWRNKKQIHEAYDKSFLDKFGLKADGEINVAHFYRSMLPLPQEYFNSVKNIGSVAVLSGFINGNRSPLVRDNVNRNHSYVAKYADGYIPSLSLKAYLIGNNNPKIIISNNSISFPELNYTIRQKKSYFQLSNPVKFYTLNGDYSHKSYSAIDIITSYNNIKSGKKPIISPSEFDNKYIIIGANVPAGSGLNDNKHTPMRINHPGADYQATTLDNILHNDFLFVAPTWFTFLLTVFGMFAVYLIIRISNLSRAVKGIIGIAFGYLIFTVICYYYGFVVNVVTPVVMFIMTTILGFTHKFILENKSKEKVKTAMGKYMSEDVMKRVVQNIDNLGLGGKKSTVTVLFSDIRGFTSMSEQMTAQEVSEILNEYFSEMEPIITKYNGIINKFIGDAVMAIFGEPIQDKNHAQNAVRCAYDMLNKVKELQKKWAKEGKPKIEIGIGINTGEVFVGNIGSNNRMEYTVIGDTVNLASRLESYNKVYKTNLLISSTTYEEVKGFTDVIKISDVQIRGKSNKMDIYEVLKVTD